VVDYRRCACSLPRLAIVHNPPFLPFLLLVLVKILLLFVFLRVVEESRYILVDKAVFSWGHVGISGLSNRRKSERNITFDMDG